MKRMKRNRVISWILSAVLALSVGFLPGVSLCEVLADADGQTYVALGADLNDQERAEVLRLLGLTEEELENCTVVEVTNEEEHRYLDSYLSSSVIGSRALSSVVVKNREEGYGIHVKTYNISYCTVGMYQNALATAGIKDADLIVAGPFSLSGTAALVGAMEAYSEMSGEPLKAENIETATDELVTTSWLGESLGDQVSAEELVGAVKDIIVSEEIRKPEDIEEVIKDTADKMEITLTEEQLEKIRELMEKISKLDLDISQLQEQLQGLYEKLEGLDLDLNLSTEQVNGILDRLGQWFSGVWEKLGSFFGEIFQ
ncbi:MAG: DUF1002 domain-containing protein [Fusicatenibacter sp.]